MKTKITYFVILIALFFTSGCTEQNKSKNHQNIHTQDEKTEIDETLTLNNGEKWHINDEMKPYILESDSILNDYIISESNDYKNLAGKLAQTNSSFMKSCTMTGESHEELHKWLYPHMQLIDSLAKSENLVDAQSLILDLKISFETFNQYFK